jgi:hypothetical protein
MSIEILVATIGFTGAAVGLAGAVYVAVALRRLRRRRREARGV